MASMIPPINRRDFVTSALAAASAMSLGNRQAVAAESPQRDYEICVFMKYLQSLSYEELARVIAEMGFDGIEGTVRKRGYILPEHAPDKLPKLVEVLGKHGLNMTIMTSDITRADQPHAEKLLRTAASLGIKWYRMGYYRYDLKRPILDQLREFRPALRDLAALNRELGITAVYQNHAGAQFMGATIWDLHSLIKDIPVEEVSCAFDVRHVAVEAGHAWPVLYDVIKPHIGVVFVKDYRWQGPNDLTVPLGSGQVDPKVIEMIKASDFVGPISLHVEYNYRSGTASHIESMRKDIATLRRWLQA